MSARVCKLLTRWNLKEVKEMREANEVNHQQIALEAAKLKLSILEKAEKAIEKELYQKNSTMVSAIAEIIRWC